MYAVVAAIMSASIGDLESTTAQSAVSHDSSSQMVEVAVDSRRSIERGHLKLQSVGRRLDRKTGDFRNEELSLSLFFDGRKLRCDVERGEGGPAIECRGCLPEDAYIAWRPDQEDNKSSNAVRVYDPRLVRQERTFLPDPRALGMVPIPLRLLHNYSLEWLNNNFTAKSSERVRFRGHDCLRIALESPSITSLEVWIAPELDHSVLRMVAREDFPTRGTSLTNTMDCDVSKIADQESWFPTTIRYSRINEKGELLSDETVKIKVVSLNEPLPKSTFTLAGFGTIPRGTLVEWRKPSPQGGKELDVERGRWNGLSVEFNSANNAFQQDKARLPLIDRE